MEGDDAESHLMTITPATTSLLFHIIIINYEMIGTGNAIDSPSAPRILGSLSELKLL